MTIVSRLAAISALLLAFLHHGARADTGFYDDMSDGNIADWSLSSSLAYLNSASGNYAIGFRSTATASKAISTAGLSRVTVSVMLAASSLEAGDTCLVEISTNGGSAWSTLFSISDGQDDNTFRIGVAAPAGADNNASVLLRFRAATGASGDYCYGDDIQLNGDDGYDSEGFGNLPGTGAVTRSQLTYSTLTTGTGNGNRIDLAAYALPAAGAQPSHSFQGRLTLVNTASNGGFVELKDSFSYTGNTDATRKHLPPFDFEFVQTGSHLIPAQRESIASSHPEWEYILLPGRVWNESGDHGFSRAAIPFALQQKNANCTHNGVMSFLFKTDGTVSKVAYQLSSETCLYFKVDMWGLLSATYTPGAVADAAALISDYQAQVNARLPMKSLEELELDFPSLDVAKMAASNSTDPKHISLVGFVKNGVHYSGGCRTRWGLYPYCASLVVPSYSAAKSAFAGLAMMRLEKKYPNSKNLYVAPYVSDCNSNGLWGDVKLENILDMATGNYAQAGYMTDEGATHTNGLFLATSHADKINYSCTQYSRKATPGSKWVYHSSDTYIAGTVMNAVVKSYEGSGKDIFIDTMVSELWAPLQLSETARYTRRSYDSTAQAFTGYGLSWLRSDVARIGKFIGADDGTISGSSMLDTALLDAALQRTATDRGLTPLTDYRYNNGYWALNIKTSLGCANDVYVPFMSGYGGISVLLLPNDAVYYYFSDNDSYYWLDAALEANKLGALCQ